MSGCGCERSSSSGVPAMLAMRSVAIRPGATLFSRMPSFPSSRDSVLNAPTAAGRWLFESISPGIGSLVAVEVTFTIRPQPRARMSGTTASIRAIGASTRLR